MCINDPDNAKSMYGKITYDEAMERCVDMLKVLNAGSLALGYGEATLITVFGWCKSPGAVVERDLALELGMNIIYDEEGKYK